MKNLLDLPAIYFAHLHGGSFSNLPLTEQYDTTLVINGAIFLGL